MKVVIVGGGFGGVRAALKLANRKGIDVKLISPQSYFEYHAALYRSATGRSPLEVAIPLKDFFGYAKNVEVIDDTIEDIDSKDQVVVGKSDSRYEYEKLIIAIGNVTEYFGIEGLKEYSYGVKTIQEALKLKRHLHDQLLESDADRNYVVIGAGPTGVELSAELASYLKKIRAKHKIKRNFTIDLIEAGPRPVATMPEKYSQAIVKRLKKLHVKTYFNTAVKAENVDGIQLPNGPIRSHTVVWTAGVTNNPFFAKFPHLFELGKAKRVVVDKHLQAKPNIYVIGDCAVTEYTGMAQTALHDAEYVVDDILRTLHGKTRLDYMPKRPIYAIPVGRHWAVVLWGKTQINGWFGWVLRRLADLRLYLHFLPLGKALTTWKYGFEEEEICPVCK